ncbi:MAG: hypothetical protein IJQ31_03190 [Thermoguttaceae bacterium]|nr:hypothetical protein [Thermoguttaceae bacterium]
MGIFGRSEKELEEFQKQLIERATGLNNRETKLKNRESDIRLNEANIEHERKLLDEAKATFAKERTDYLEEVKRTELQIAEERTNLESRRQEIVRLESEAKANFARVQEETFKEVIEKRITALDARENDLEKRSQKIAEDIANAIAKEGEIARRELAVAEREQRADAGFADKVAELAAQTQIQTEANNQKVAQLKEREENLTRQYANLEAEKESLRQREQKVAEAELLRDTGYSDMRAGLEAELNQKRVEFQNESAQLRSVLEQEMTTLKSKLLAELETQITDIREKRLAEITDAEEKVRMRVRKKAEEEALNIRKAADEEALRVRNEIRREREEWDAEKQSQKSELKRQNEANEKKEGELSNKEDALKGREHELKLRESRLETDWGRLEKTIEDGVEERRKSFEKETNALKEEMERLRNDIQVQMKLVGVFDELKRQLGEKDPEEVLRDLNSKSDEISQLREELANRPTDEMRERYEQLESEKARYERRIEELKDELRKNEEALVQTEELKHKNNLLEIAKNNFEKQAEEWKGIANDAQAKLKRLSAAYETSEGVGDRCKEIEKPQIPKGKFVLPDLRNDIDEMDWLNNIYKKCENHGLHFPRRILKAFHTAVKTSEWSPITVLAGVSGTGKSELPKLYSHFGGLLFEMVSVQPNWDSQESMLGFFNSIDNKFDAQPVLHFLAQSQKEYTNDYPGLKNAVCMILLDEMNLAHPELYFSEFLSKLENRRGKYGEDVPNLEVKIGAGMPPYLLPLDRNVLWTGTMNQDETTKSLSDKVLDRSIIIHFPRPKELKRRKVLKPLTEKNRGTLLHRDNYFNWFSRESLFTDEQINPYKDFIEQINESLRVTGRAIGHRVWQAIEYYMANYPDVRAALKKEGDGNDLEKAMHTAFEDQLVQKVMPKLRGIDTGGLTKTQCLDKIQGLLNIGVKKRRFNLIDDFENACELGYGQFMWMSADYLNQEMEESVKNESGKEDDENASDESEDIPIPNWYQPNNANREKMWNSLTLKAKKKEIQRHQRYRQ